MADRILADRLLMDLQKQDLLELLRQVFTHLEEGVLFADNSGQVLFYNQAAASLEGLQPQQVVGRHIDSLFLPESAVAKALHQAMLGESCDDLLLTEFDDKGRPVRIQVRCYPMRLQGRQVGVLRLTRDLALWVPELHEKKPKDLQRPVAESPLADGAAVLCGRSPAVRALEEAVQRLQHASGPVLIWGPPGCGRSSLAKLLHRGSGPLHICDFRFRSATTQEISLFGTEDTLGLWQQTSGGTLILEEVHLASPRLQSLLVDRLADADAPRCILVLPGDPQEAIACGVLHPALWDRCIADLEVPALADRGEDLPQICQYLLRRINLGLNTRIFGLTPLAKEALQKYPWPGGLRELYSVLEGAVTQAEGTVITPELLPSLLHQVNQGLVQAAESPVPYPQRYHPARFHAHGSGDSADAASLRADAGPSPAHHPAPESDDDFAASVAERVEVRAEGNAAAALEAADADANALTKPAPAKSRRRRMGESEKNMIIDALRIHDYDIVLAAKQMGMRESTLRRRLIQYEIHLPEEEHE